MQVLAALSFLVTIQAAAAQFNWRLYNNGGCDHNSTAVQTFPPLPGVPKTSNFDTCVASPAGIAWNRLETSSTLEVFVFCNADCTGNSQDNVNFCSSAPSEYAPSVPFINAN
ncbi:hypothetical protein B0H17DRAFT_1154602 [Mycena rosella]|uniref:Uncharacterized protein n=1 Tax=Mycena rosella TaxID=1033263 RepID=A0AAD7AYK5_MYCRO|nr:hypothetical protein B0H17DRAFT_1154602 [Mycena rosella]